MYLAASTTGTLVLQGMSQMCANSVKCYDSCDNDANANSCCVLELPPNPSEADYPLGFQLYFLPGDNSPDPDPCIRINFPSSAYATNTLVNYLVLAVSASLFDLFCYLFALPHTGCTFVVVAAVLPCC